jgi:hypothetical protein
VVPEELVLGAGFHRKECEGLEPPRGIWTHVTGTDLVRDSDGQFYVLEDNLRCPSGVSYVLENRHVLKHTFPQVFADSQVRPVDDYGDHLLETLENAGQPLDGRLPRLDPLRESVLGKWLRSHSAEAAVILAEVNVGLSQGMQQNNQTDSNEGVQAPCQVAPQT